MPAIHNPTSPLSSHLSIVTSREVRDRETFDKWVRITNHTPGILRGEKVPKLLDDDKRQAPQSIS
jgi:hypothetical protein